MARDMRRRDAVISLPMSRAGSQARSFFYDVLIAAADRRPRGENSGLLCGGYPPQNRCPASEVPGQETNRRAWQRRIGTVNQIELGGLADCDLADNGCSPPPQAVLSSIATSSSYSLVIRTPLSSWDRSSRNPSSPYYLKMKPITSGPLNRSKTGDQINRCVLGGERSIHGGVYWARPCPSREI
jgi:hypothetical protein